MARNVEIKARLKNRDAVFAVLTRLSDRLPETIKQRDYFFQCDGARLKLRIFESGQGELIRYEREDRAMARCSQYQIVRTPDPFILLDILTRTLGRTGEVKKTRELYMIGQTRVHLDRVEGLGDFLELEVVLRAEQSEAEGQEIAGGVLKELGIEKEQLVAEAYVDLLERSRPYSDSAAPVR